MVAAHIVIGSLVLGLSLIAGLWGCWCWWRRPQARSFWIVLRLAQGAVVVQALWGGGLVVLHHQAAALHILYGILPLLVSFIGEQLRLVSANTVLASRGFESTEPVAQLPRGEQTAIVVAIMRREVGIMAASSLVVFTLAGRAAQCAGLF